MIYVVLGAYIGFGLAIGVCFFAMLAAGIIAVAKAGSLLIGKISQKQ